MSNEQSASTKSPRAFEPLAALVRQSFSNMRPEQCLRGEAALNERLTSLRNHTPRRLWVAPALACAACALVVGVWRHASSAKAHPLTFVVDNGSLTEDHGASADPKAARILRFSDGTEVRVDNGAQASVRAVTHHGASVAMSRGALHAEVVHSSTSEWRFDAGPFVVRVTGTAFGLAWDPDRDRFDLRLEHGSVTVTSPVANDPIPLRAGQWLTIRPRSNEVFIRDLTGVPPAVPNAEPVPESSPATVPLAPSSAGSGLLPSVVPSKVRPTASVGHDWARDLADGKVEFVVEDAVRRGLDSCLAEASGGELAALADAARYSRHDQIAQKVMLAERARFPGSRSAVDAGLFLGRLAEAGHDDRQALRWFDTYLTEAPAGRFASEALGRKMALVRRSISASAARAIAEQYLAKFPAGIYASAARAILNVP